MNLSDQQRREAIALCDQIQITVKKLAADFARLKDAAREFERNIHHQPFQQEQRP